MDIDLLIHSDAHGNPNLYGGHLHWCRFTDNPRQHTVAQMMAGGQYPNSDCGDALILARLLDDGRSDPMTVLEREAATTATGGTTDAGMVAAYAANRYTAHPAAGDPPPSEGMNPAWGGLISISQFPVYLAASTHSMVVVDTPGSWDKPAPAPVSPPPPTYEDEAMNAPMWDATTAPWQPNQNIAWIDKTGALHQRWSPETGGAGHSAVLATGMEPSSPIDLFVDGPRKTVHLRARTASGDLWHAWEVASAAWGSELIA